MTKERLDRMNECKACGKPVRYPIMLHAACWENAICAVAQDFCDNYCRWPHECANEDDLQDNHCNDCSLVKALNVGGSRYRGKGSEVE